MGGRGDGSGEREEEDAAEAADAHPISKPTAAVPSSSSVIMFILPTTDDRLGLSGIPSNDEADVVGKGGAGHEGEPAMAGPLCRRCCCR